MPHWTAKYRFYCPPDCFASDRIVFPADEARHAVKVMRLSEGDVVTVVDGAGGVFTARLETVTRKMVVGRVETRLEDATGSGIHVCIGLALLKQSARFETFLEKATELGVAEIMPLTTSRSEQKSFRRGRAEAILVSALKQSERTVLPKLHDPVGLEDALHGASGTRLIAHEASDASHHIRNRLPATATHVTLLVGPEGGFTGQEVETAVSAGWDPVWLGERRLRAETAALAAAGFIIMSLER